VACPGAVAGLPAESAPASLVMIAVNFEGLTTNGKPKGRRPRLVLTELCHFFRCVRARVVAGMAALCNAYPGE
jgi:hypothetical protein